MLRASRLAPKPPSKLPTRGTGLAEPGVVAGDRHVADQVEDVPAADGIARDHRDHGLREAADLHVQVSHVQAPDALLGDLVVADVAVVAADALVAARAERLIAGPGEDDRRDLDVVASAAERVAELAQGRRAEGVAHLGAVDRDLRDALGALVEHVLVVAAVVAPLDRAVEGLLGRGVLVSDRHRGGEHSPPQCPERMLLDNWLAQRAETCPDRIAVVTEAGSIDYAGLEAEASAMARRLAAKGVRRDSIVAISMTPGLEYATALHALMKLGATAFPVDPRLGRRRARRCDRPPVAGAGGRVVGRPQGPRGRHAAARRARPRPAMHAGPHERHVRRVAPGRAHLRQPPLERGRIRLQPGSGSFRPLALLRADVPRLGHLDPVALGDLRHDRGRPGRLRRRPRRRVARARRRHDRLARDDDADAADRRRCRDRAAPRDPRRRRARPRRDPRGGARAGGDRRPDLRADRGELAGDDPRPRGRRAQARVGRPAAADDPRAHRRRRDPRAGADGRPRARSPTMDGCTPATSGA